MSLSYKNLDSNALKKLYKSCAVFVFLDVPTGTHFGIDLNSWDVGPNFRGVKLIPPGIHYIYFSAVSKLGDTAPRTGFFYNFKSEEILLKRWDHENEGIKIEPENSEEISRIKTNLLEIDRFLGAYPCESYKKWLSLTENLTPDLLSKLEPENKIIFSVAQLKSNTFTSSNSAKKKIKDSEESTEKELGPLPDDVPGSSSKHTDFSDYSSLNMNCLPGTQIKFSELSSKRHPSGSTPAEITKYGMDSSYVLQNLLDSYSHQSDILGELQLAFVCFLVGNVYDAFEQWKKIARLLCTCDEALVDHPELYTKYLTALYYHIEEVPEDFFVDIVSSDNFLTNTLQIFFENVRSSNATEDLKMRAKKFQQHLTRRFSWNFNQEPDDCAPIIVENIE